MKPWLSSGAVCLPAYWHWALSCLLVTASHLPCPQVCGEGKA